MHLQLFALLGLHYTIATGNILADRNILDSPLDSTREKLPRGVAPGALNALDRREASFPNLVPTTTVNLSTDPPASTTVTLLRNGQTTYQATHTSTKIASQAPGFSSTTLITASNTAQSSGAVSTGPAASSVQNTTILSSSTAAQTTGRNHHTGKAGTTSKATGGAAASTKGGSQAGQSSTSQGGGNTFYPVSWIGMLLLMLAGV